jgi:serine/threonine protein kinase
VKKRYGQWIKGKQLGHGGQGETFLTQREGSEEKFVLKLFSRNSRDWRAEREVSALKDIDHPNVMRIIDYQLNGNERWMVSEYLPGGDLLRALTHNSLSLHEKLELFTSACRGLAFVHEQKFTHRDIKPKNIFLRGAAGQAVIGDFGLVHMPERSRRTGTREQVGSQNYCAPELTEGRAEDIRPSADVYSLGKTLWVMFSGAEQAFSGSNQRTPKRDLATLTNDPKLQIVSALIDQMIAENPDQRLPDATAVLAALEVAKSKLEVGLPIDDQVLKDYVSSQVTLRKVLVELKQEYENLRREHNDSVDAYRRIVKAATKTLVQIRDQIADFDGNDCFSKVDQKSEFITQGSKGLSGPKNVQSAMPAFIEAVSDLASCVNAAGQLSWLDQVIQDSEITELEVFQSDPRWHEVERDILIEVRRNRQSTTTSGRSAIQARAS